MAKKKANDQAPESVSSEPETVENPETVAETAPVIEEGTPLPVVDIEAALQAESLSEVEQATGQSFWFGQTQLFKFADGTTFHASKNRAYVTDPVAIANLIEASKNPSNRIFPE